MQRLKLALSERAPKTVNNVLTVLSTLLKKAVEWGELERLPCVIKLLPNPKKTMGFHDFDHYERFLTVARKRGEDAYLMVLAGGDARLRLGRLLPSKAPQTLQTFWRQGQGQSKRGGPPSR